jgi:RHS repeat-associated protein
VTHLLDGRSTPSYQTGNVIESYTYDVYGAPVFLDASGNQRNPNCTAYNNRFLFTGREYAATYRSTYVQTFTFYEYRARAYNPQLGRFMSEDPKLFDAGDYNLFRYCHNDPVDFTDPMGLDDTAPTYSPRQTSLQKAEEEYGKAMAAAQWAGSDLMHNATGAMGIGMTGYAYVQQTIVTGQLKGSMANPALLRNAKPGDPNDRDAPTGLEITNRVDDRGFYKQHHLQVKDGKGIWKGTGIAEEHVEARAGNLRLQPSGPTLFEHGDLVDRVGPLRQPGPNVTGYLLTHQSYKLYYPTPEGLRYINLPGPGFWQYTNIYRGQVTNADLGYWGH